MEKEEYESKETKCHGCGRNEFRLTRMTEQVVIIKKILFLKNLNQKSEPRITKSKMITHKLGHQKKPKKPSKCPKCRSERIKSPIFSILSRSKQKMNKS